MLRQSTIIGVDGPITKILAEVYFAIWPNPQTARVYFTKSVIEPMVDPTTGNPLENPVTNRGILVTTVVGEEKDTGVVVAPTPGTNVGLFEFIPEATGLYSFRTVSESLGKIGGSWTKSLYIGDIVTNPITEAEIVNPTTNDLITVS